MAATKHFVRVSVWAMLLGLLGAFCLASEAEAARPCDPAVTLVESGRPQAALEFVRLRENLMDSATDAGSCLGAVGLAALSVGKAQVLASEGQKAFDDHDWDLARSKNAAALRLDADNTEARGLKAKIDDLPKAVGPSSMVKSWNEAVKGILAPVGVLLLTVLAGAIGMALLARLVSRAWGPPSSASSDPKLARWVGRGLIGFSAVGVVGLLSLRSSEQIAKSGTLLSLAVGLGVGALVGVGLLSWATATRLSVTVRASGASGEQVAHEVQALLERIGGSPPQGLDRAQGTDIQALAAVIGGVKFAGAGDVVSKLVGSLAGLVSSRSPWQVFVDTQDGSTAISVMHNGRNTGSISLRNEELGVRGVEAKLPVEPFAAAFVLTRLAARYQLNGLAGAAHWRSIGLHFLATTAFRQNHNHSVALLNEAVAIDPANCPAQLALANRHFREKTDVESLGRYREWLSEQLTKLSADKTRSSARDGQVTHWLRTHLTRAVTEVNWYFASRERTPNEIISKKALSKKTLSKDTDPKDTDPREPLSKVLEELLGAAKWASTNDGEKYVPIPNRDAHRAWVRSVQAMAAALHHVMDPAETPATGNGGGSGGTGTDDQGKKYAIPDPPAAWREYPRSPRIHYAWACAYLAPIQREEQRELGLQSLRLAVIDPEVADWMHKDPQLKTFWANNDSNVDEFRKAPSGQLLTVELFKPYAETLTLAGLTVAAAIAELTPDELGQWSVAPLASRRSMVDVSKMVLSLEREDKSLKPLAIEIAGHLAKKGFTSGESLTSHSESGRQQELEDLHESLRGVRGASSDEVKKALRRWFSLPKND